MNEFDKVDPTAEEGVNRLRRLLREPLLQFLLFGAIIFFGTHFVKSLRNQSAPTIVVDEARVQHLSQRYQTQLGMEPTSEQMQYLIENYIRDEIFYREALALGLNHDDEIIRRRLIQKMEFLYNDLTEVPEPTEEELLDYFHQHSARFTSPATVSFRHLYFSADGEGDEAARRSAEMLLAATVSSQLADAGETVRGGDPFPLQNFYSAITETEAAKVFGRTPLVASLFSVPERSWQGPFRSGYGWHLIFIDKRVDIVLPPFASVRDRVRETLMEERRQSANTERFAELKSHYNIVRRDRQRENP